MSNISNKLLLLLLLLCIRQHVLVAFYACLPSADEHFCQFCQFVSQDRRHSRRRRRRHSRAHCPFSSGGKPDAVSHHPWPYPRRMHTCDSDICTGELKSTPQRIRELLIF